MARGVHGYRVPMSIPNHYDIVHRLYLSREWTLTTPAGACAFTDAAVRALHAADPNWGHLRKTYPQNGCYASGSLTGHAIDAAMWLPTGQTVDFIVSAGGPDARGIGWTVHEGDAYPPERWYAPQPAAAQPEPPPFVQPPPPPPAPSVDLTAVLNRLSQMDADIANALERLIARLDKLEARPHPVYETKAGPFPIVSKPRP